MENLYLCVMHSGTMFSNIVRFFTRSKSYSHTCISFEKSLNPMYSFGRLYYFTPIPGGFVHEGFGTAFYNHYPKGRLRVYEISLTEMQMQTVKQRVDKFVLNRKKYKYGYLNCFWHMLKKPCKREYHHTCTSFCGQVLQDILPFDKPDYMLEPLDFCKFDLPVVYEGSYKNFKGL